MPKKKFLLPKTIYETLPLFYMLMGLAAVFTLHTTLAWVSGGLLVITSLLIYKMRRNYRSPHQALNRKLRQHRV